MGLTIGAGVGAWVEYMWLRRVIVRNLGVRVHLGGVHRGRLLIPSAAAVVTALVGRAVLDTLPRWIGGTATVVLVGAVYVLVARWTRVDEAAVLLRQVRRRLPGR
jgi:hypothetical protein